MHEEVNSLVEKLRLPQSIYDQTSHLTRKFSSLMSQMGNISQTINNISGPVTILELQRHNAKKALSYVDDLILFSTKMKEFNSALKYDNIPYAAQLCGEIANIPMHIPIPEIHEFQILKEEVCEKVKKKFGEGLSENNKEIIEQYAGLFQHLQLGREGIERYIQYIIDSLKGQFESIEQLLASNGSFEDTLIKIYRATVKTYEGQQENVSKEFGSEGNLELLQSLQSAVDGFAVKIIEKYSVEVLKKPKSLGLCEEMSKIIKHTESFEIYIHKIGKKLVRVVNLSDLDEKFSHETGLLKNSGLKSKIFELADFYISMEYNCLKESIEALMLKLSITQYCEKSFASRENLCTGPVFEKLDECFFLVQNTANRVFASLNISSICAILNNFSALISEDILDPLYKKFPNSKTQWTTSPGQNISIIIVVLNLINNCKKCIKKIVTTLEQQFSKIFGLEGNDSIMFKHCLAAISDSETKAKMYIDECLAFCVKSAPLTSFLVNFRSLNYEISLEQHSDYEVNDPFALKLVKDIKSVLKQWKMQLVAEVFECLVDIIAEDLAKAIEIEVRGKRFNELGALQFQKDIREIIGQLQHMSNKPLRHRFARLKQISELILARDDHEITSLTKDTEWKLIERENVLYRKLRVC